MRCDQFNRKLIANREVNICTTYHGNPTNSNFTQIYKCSPQGSARETCQGIKSVGWMSLWKNITVSQVITTWHLSWLSLWQHSTSQCFLQKPPTLSLWFLFYPKINHYPRRKEFPMTYNVVTTVVHGVDRDFSGTGFTYCACCVENFKHTLLPIYLHLLWGKRKQIMSSCISGQWAHHSL